MSQKITFAIPKGRIYEELEPFFNKVGLEPEADFFDSKSRKLEFATNHEHMSIIRVRSFDVATFVAFGAAQIGVVGSDVLEEFDYADLYAPVDLGIGKCRLSVAVPNAFEETGAVSHLRVATKYPNLTKKYYAKQGIQAECIKLNGAMELAPSLGLSERIVDLVSTGNTLKANGLRETDVMIDISSRLIVNRAALKTQNAQLAPMIEQFREVVSA